MFGPAHHMFECSIVLKKRWHKCVVVGRGIILLGIACLRAPASLIYHSLNKNVKALIYTEFSRNFCYQSPCESRIPSVIAHLSIFAFDSRHFNPLYRLACVNSFSWLDCLVVLLSDILGIHIWFILWESPSWSKQ